MLSKNRIKFIHSLKRKKFRETHHRFLVEGSKLVLDLLRSPYSISEIFVTHSWIAEKVQEVIQRKVPVTEITEAEMEKITSLSTPSPVLAIVEIPAAVPDVTGIAGDLVLMLDDIRDPGNLGTIIRIADWFGIRTIICSENTVDLYNPKVVQSTMGSIAKVDVFYRDLKKFLEDLPHNIKIYGTFLDGENIYTGILENKGIVIIGNESNGISGDVSHFVSNRLCIPAFTPGKPPDSLNASVATAIVCSEFRRRTVSGSNPSATC